MHFQNYKVPIEHVDKVREDVSPFQNWCWPSKSSIETTGNDKVEHPDDTMPWLCVIHIGTGIYTRYEDLADT